MDKTFKVILSGKPLPGHSRESAAAALAQLVRVPEAKALDLLSGVEKIVKQGIDEKQATQYLAALERAGVGARVEPMAVAAPAPAPASTPASARAPATAPAAQPVPTVTCPACGVAQPKRTLCRGCGADMPRLLAAREEAARNPAGSVETAHVVQAARPMFAAPEDRPFYRRSLFIEILFFLFISVLWGYFAMTDRDRGAKMRVFGGAIFVVFGISTLLTLYSYAAGPDEKVIGVLDANIYAATIADKVADYAIEKQELPADGRAIELPVPRPASVRSLTIGPAGRVQVVLHDEFSTGGTATITYMPTIDGQKLRLPCATENISTKHISRRCQ